MARVYLSLGSNQGRREENLQAALNALQENMTLLARSSVYETPPWGYAEQPSFLNMAVCVETDWPPLRLLDYLKDLESKLGRIPTFRYGPRKIDVDILFYDDLIYEDDRLSIPHPRLAERAFVLVPLAEIAPSLIHPALRRSVRDLLKEVHSEDIQPLQTDR